jgi:hypothetical protein
MIVMKLHVSMFALLSIMVSLIQPAWSMEGNPSETKRSAKRKRDEKKESLLPRPSLKNEKKDEDAIHPLLEKEKEIEASPQPLKERDLEEDERNLMDSIKLRPYFDNGYLQIRHC